MLASLLLAAAASFAPDSLGPRLETGCTGGVTGGGGGAVVTASGHFYRWRTNRPILTQPPLTLVTTDSVRAALFIRLALDAGIERIRFSEPSNMTCFLRWRPAEGPPRSVAWPMGSANKAILGLMVVSDSIGQAASGR